MILKASGLTSIRSGRIILQPTDLEIEPGARIGLVGASGSGKSTLGHTLIDDLSRQGKRIAHVPQSPDEALDPLRSMDFHWREAETALGIEHDPKQQQHLFNEMEIAGADMRKRPWAWSRGMQQRFVIAMALIGMPDLMILDEPTSALDPIIAANTMKLLSDHLSKHNTAMLLITHDLGLAASYVDRLMVLHDGRIVEDAATAQILNAPRSMQARSLAAHRNWLSLPC